MHKSITFILLCFIIVAMLAASLAPSAAQGSATATPGSAFDATATAVIHAAETAHASMLDAFATPEPVEPSLLNMTFLHDTSLADNEPCAAPCWRGIVAGVTGWDDAIALLEADDTIANIELQVNDESGEFAATFEGADGVPCCLLYSGDGETVHQLLLQLAPQVTLGEVIENLGEPAFLSGAEVTPDQAAAALFYPDLPLIVYAFIDGALRGVITEDSEVFAALYLNDSDMRDVIESSNLYAWTGYNSYRGYLAQPFAVTPVSTPAD